MWKEAEGTYRNRSSCYFVSSCYGYWKPWCQWTSSTVTSNRITSSSVACEFLSKKFLHMGVWVEGICDVPIGVVIIPRQFLVCHCYEALAWSVCLNRITLILQLLTCYLKWLCECSNCCRKYLWKFNSIDEKNNLWAVYSCRDLSLQGYQQILLTRMVYLNILYFSTFSVQLGVGIVQNY